MLSKGGRAINCVFQLLQITLNVTLELTLWVLLQPTDQVHPKNSSNNGTRTKGQCSHLHHEGHPECPEYRDSAQLHIKVNAPQHLISHAVKVG